MPGGLSVVSFEYFVANSSSYTTDVQSADIMRKEHGDYLDRIEQDPEIMVGKPVVRGTRIPIERVLAHLEENDRADLFAAFPELTEEDVRACLAYARAALERERAGAAQAQA